jgi:hypothetical protein
VAQEFQRPVGLFHLKVDLTDLAQDIRLCQPVVSLVKDLLGFEIILQRFLVLTR